MPFKRISIEQAQVLINTEEVTLLDIRDPDSFAAGNIENAIHVTNDNVQAVEATANKDQPLIIYCYHGNSSQGAADYFSSLGFKQCYSVDGGFEEWKFKV
jgi:thiosulfate sulfurtransferase|tara:strand:- start:704 stop:1003 length:300 start_codon:yes stop_codon:yes gene_type:complete